MVTANRVGPSYGVEISNGQSLVRSDTRKLGAGGDTGMRCLLYTSDAADEQCMV